DEPTADDHDPLADWHPVAAVDVEEIVDGLHDSVEVSTLDADAAPAPRADAEEDGVEALGAKLRHAELRRQPAAVAHFDAQALDLGHRMVDHLARQAIARDAVAHHAAGERHRLEHGHGMAQLRQVVSAREAGGARAYDRDTTARRARRPTVDHCL